MDLNGRVDVDDYFLIDSGFLGGLSGYRNGDLNLSLTVDADDYSLIDSAFAEQSRVLALASAVTGVVPEPGVLGSVALSCMALAMRRQSRNPRRNRGSMNCDRRTVGAAAPA
jgi:hypothetical protein